MPASLSMPPIADSIGNYACRLTAYFPILSRIPPNAESTAKEGDRA